MNEEFLCRGKRVELINGKAVFGDWIEGYYYNQNTRMRINGEYVECPYILVYDSHASVPGFGNYGAPRSYTVYPATVGRCTGLKDKNDKLVFDGDVVKATNKFAPQPEVVFRVKYGAFEPTFFYECARHFAGVELKNKVFGLYAESNKGEQMLITDATNLIEVVGNIHDNPELMEDKNEM